MISDPIADMLTRIRNGVMARHEVVIMPASRMKQYLAKVMKQEGFIAGYEVIGAKPKRQLKIVLRYDEGGASFVSGLERISKPGLRVYVQRGEIPRVYGGLGIAIVSTSKGVMTGSQAWRQGLGGELLCKVW
ncbi:MULTISPECIES: 30S ribosomal protein S8 [Dehalococcoides]|jgi:small subunit ribosomal protein S8|uniref:Small ribosomal subunit protein uS8 n=1 Tax=Dehalococcoides mccartyi (strain VS) TaxID=311424 RepID=D2BGY5_DEHMV|nr:MULTISPECIES: 30S ribosomal protein S8 [Dehalococcoides]ACZ61585.1 ribosomal protein S8 [Dehalococcoides mccartyi VS]AHB13197.1 30S ribosomal protein S8 [Dehalococcoides mccartyi GY50]AII57633.1 30S ribosomal protein S8 [Dehalococcoides mccartyi CG1]APH12117.1 30S ribosomal protein S8 [Dehalococcoides mccartyi]QYY58278.1 30S ribosomal protein S8 [Dehalococcoides mccartyi]